MNRVLDAPQAATLVRKPESQGGMVERRSHRSAIVCVAKLGSLAADGSYTAVGNAPLRFRANILGRAVPQQVLAPGRLGWSLRSIDKGDGS